MTTKQIPVWIDCDTGTDDSVAIMLGPRAAGAFGRRAVRRGGQQPPLQHLPEHTAHRASAGRRLSGLSRRGAAPLCGNRTWPASSMAKTASEMSSCPCRTVRLKHARVGRTL